MLLEIPYTYWARVIPAGCRSVRAVGVRAVHLAIVPELGTAQAPLAGRLRWYQDQDGPDRIYYTHGGGLLVNLVSTFRIYGRARGDFTLETIQDALLGAAGQENHDPLLTPLDTIINVKGHWMQHGTAVREHGDDNRQDRLAQIRRIVAGWSFVDGLLCEPSRGPGWKVRWTDARRNGGRASVGVEAVIEHQPGHGCFTAVRQEEAMAMAEGYRRRLGLPEGYEFRTRADIEVFDPAAFAGSRRDRWDAFTAALQRLVQSSTKDAGGWPRDAVHAWLELRDALVQRWPADGEDWACGLAEDFRRAHGADFRRLRHADEVLSAGACLADIVPGMQITAGPAS